MLDYLQRTSNRPCRRIRRLTHEKLEVRVVLDGTASAASGLPWFEPGSLTYSFVPDGTPLASEESSLFSLLAPTGSVEDWQGEFARAMDAWLSTLSTNATQVSDSGAPFGSHGPSQGDSRFGDIRIGAVPLSQNTMAEAVPHSMITQGTWAGDILLNANAPWSNLQQVYAVALHEFGHALGIGHSDDPASPMYFHGVHDSPGPTTEDIALLHELYHGVDIDSGGDDHDHDEPPNVGNDYRDEPEFNFDPETAIPLTADVASTARYYATGTLTEQVTSIVYRLDPIGEIDHFEFLNVTARATEWNGLIVDAELLDHSGEATKSTVVRNSSGVLVIQAAEVEPNQTYYLVVSTVAAAANHQVGGFEVLAEYGTQELKPTHIMSFELNETRPIMEQAIQLDSSRLVHLMIGPLATLNDVGDAPGGSNSSQSGSQTSPPTAAIWATVVDKGNNIIAQLAMRPGETRSAPLVFLNKGVYRLIVETGTSDRSPPMPTALSLLIDEVSLDVGPGVVDPSVEPVLSCFEINADPNNCITNRRVIVVGRPVFPDPGTLPDSPTYPSIPPWLSLSWYFWPSMNTVTKMFNNQRSGLSGFGQRQPSDARASQLVDLAIDSLTDDLVPLSLVSISANCLTPKASQNFYFQSKDSPISSEENVLTVSEPDDLELRWFSEFDETGLQRS